MSLEKSAPNALVIDDYFIIRHNHRLLLQKVGFVVVESANGQEALNILSEKGPSYFSLIILDLMMPMMSGEEFIGHVKELFGDKLPQILVCTSTSDLPVVKKMAQAGIAGYLVKPVDYKALIKKLQSMFPELLPQPPPPSEPQA